MKVWEWLDLSPPGCVWPKALGCQAPAVTKGASGAVAPSSLSYADGHLKHGLSWKYKKENQALLRIFVENWEIEKKPREIKEKQDGSFQERKRPLKEGLSRGL